LRVMSRGAGASVAILEFLRANGHVQMGSAPDQWRAASLEQL